MKVYPKSIDKRPTLAEWPVRIWNISEFPLLFKNRALAWMDGNFEKYFIFRRLVSVRICEEEQGEEGNRCMIHMRCLG